MFWALLDRDSYRETGKAWERERVGYVEMALSRNQTQSIHMSYRVQAVLKYKHSC